MRGLEIRLNTVLELTSYADAGPIALQFPPSWQGMCRIFVFWLRFKD